MMQQNSAMQQQAIGGQRAPVYSDSNQVRPHAPSADADRTAGPSPKRLLHGPTVGLAIALAFSLLATGQILLFLYNYGDTLAPTRLPYAEDFAAATRLDYRQFGGRWAVDDAKLVQFDTQDTDLLAVLPRLEMPAGAPYAFGAKLQVLAGPKGGGLVFNMQDPTSRRQSHMVRFGSGDSGDYLVWGHFDEMGAYVAQGSMIPPAFSDAVELAVQIGAETYSVAVNNQTVVRDVPLQYAGGHLALTTWFSSIAFDDVAVSNGELAQGAAEAQPPEIAAPVEAEPAADVTQPIDAPAELPLASRAEPVQAVAQPAAAVAAGEDDFLASRPVDRFFTATFGAPGRADEWRIVKGDWQVQQGALVQLEAAGFDHTIVHAGRFTQYTLRARLEHLTGAGGGVVFNVPDAGSNKQGHLVRFMEPGEVAWGYFDEQSTFRGQGGAKVDPVGTEPHTLAVTVLGDSYAVSLDGTTLAADIPLMYRDGAVGLTTSESVVAFTEFSVGPE